MDNNNKNEKKIEQNNNKNKRKKIILIFLSFSLLSAGIGLGVSLSKNNIDKKDIPLVNKLVLNKNNNVMKGELDLSNSKEIEMKLQSDVDESYVNYKINVNPIFKDGKSEGNLMIQNSPNNKGILQVDILDENNELIYQSPSLEPNQFIEKDVLLKHLPKGDYDTIAYFKTFDKDTLIQTGESGFKIKLTIQN